MPFRTTLSALLYCFCLDAALAHEVWIEPLQWEIPEGDTAVANLVNGEDFEGNSLIWNPRSIVLAEKRQGAENAPLEGRLGDSPAFTTPTSDVGLLTLIYQSTHSTVTYRDYDKFAQFLTSKGWEETLQAHAMRDLPRSPVKEAYVRFAKALLAVGDGTGADTARGLELELVALDNPYTYGGDNLRVQLLYRDVPLAGNKVTVFARDAAGAANDFEMTTNGDGQVSFAPEPGMTYLVDSVLLREPKRALVVETKGAVWESLWASLTFRAPDAQ